MNRRIIVIQITGTFKNRAFIIKRAWNIVFHNIGTTCNAQVYTLVRCQVVIECIDPVHIRIQIRISTGTIFINCILRVISRLDIIIQISPLCRINHLWHLSRTGYTCFGTHINNGFSEITFFSCDQNNTICSTYPIHSWSRSIFQDRKRSDIIGIYQVQFTFDTINQH